MLIKNNSLIITYNHKESLNTFIKNMYLLVKKYKLNLIYFNKVISTKKFTILRSPHVHKAARDQIELFSIKHFFYFNNNFVLKFFLMLFKKLKTFQFKYQYTSLKKQKVLLSFFN